MVNITNQVDEVFNMPSMKVQDIVRVAKKNKISYKQAEEYLNLKLKGFEPTGHLSRVLVDLVEVIKKVDCLILTEMILLCIALHQINQDLNYLLKSQLTKRWKQALLNDEAIILNPTYRGGKITVRHEADFFDRTALIGPGQEIEKDSKGRNLPTTEKVLL